jgi:hypothetical protein
VNGSALDGAFLREAYQRFKQTRAPEPPKLTGRAKRRQTRRYERLLASGSALISGHDVDTGETHTSAITKTAGKMAVELQRNVRREQELRRLPLVGRFVAQVAAPRLRPSQARSRPSRRTTAVRRAREPARPDADADPHHRLAALRHGDAP